MENVNRKTSKQQIAYDYIRSQIMKGHYGPGYRIIIDMVANQLGISSIPVREAIRQLAADGFVEYKPYVGAVVSTINEKEYIEIMTMLAVLEGYATALAAQKIGMEQIEELECVNQNLIEAMNNWEFDRFSELNREFHTKIVDNCGSRLLTETIKNTWEQLDRVRKAGVSFPNRASHSVREHAQIIQLMREGAPFEQIEHFARKHKLNTIEVFLKRKEKEANEIVKNES